MENNKELLHNGNLHLEENLSNQYSLLKEEFERLQHENTSLQKNLERETLHHSNLYKQWNALQASILDKDREIEKLRSVQKPMHTFYQYGFFGMVLISLLLAGFNFRLFTSNKKNGNVIATTNNNLPDTKNISYATQLSEPASVNNITTPKTDGPSNGAGKKYLVKTKAYFHNKPDSTTKRTIFLLPANDDYGKITAVDDRNGFIYIVFTNHAGRVSKGWINKNDLELIK